MGQRLLQVVEKLLRVVQRGSAAAAQGADQGRGLGQIAYGLRAGFLVR